MTETEIKQPRKGLWFKLFVLACVIIISAYVLWYFVLPFVGRYERLDVFSYYWVSNSKEEIRQLVIVFENNGTQDITLNETWFDSILVDPAYWDGWFARTLGQKSTGTFYVAAKDLIFESGRGYNLTVITSRKNHFSFLLDVNENNTKTEKVEITSCHFYYWPPGSWDEIVGIEVKSFGGTDAIIKKVMVDGTLFDVSPRLWLDMFHSEDGIAVSFPWEGGETYTVSIVTVAGSTYQKTVTAD